MTTSSPLPSGSFWALIWWGFLVVCVGTPLQAVSLVTAAVIIGVCPDTYSEHWLFQLTVSADLWATALRRAFQINWKVRRYLAAYGRLASARLHGQAGGPGAQERYMAEARRVLDRGWELVGFLDLVDPDTGDRLGQTLGGDLAGLEASLPILNEARRHAHARAWPPHK